MESNDLEDLSDEELYLLAKKYKLTDKPKKELTRAILLFLILANADKFSAIYPFDPYSKTPVGIERRINLLAQYFNYKLVNNAVKIVGSTHGAKWIQWVTRPDLSKTGPCPLCAPLHGNLYRPTGFIPYYPRHHGCVCELRIIWVEETTET